MVEGSNPALVLSGPMGKMMCGDVLHTLERPRDTFPRRGNLGTKASDGLCALKSIAFKKKRKKKV